MKTIHIVNNFAGKGKADELVITNDNDEVYHTRFARDAEMYIKKALDKAEDIVKFVVYGGDGTLCEAVNGIMSSVNSHLARIKLIPSGSGNDFFKVIKDIKEDVAVDLIKYNDRYSVNMLNIGFDCNVVAATDKYKKKPLVSGSFAYILGVADILCHKMGEYFRIKITDINGKITEFNGGDYLLCAVANGQFCGGGFCNSPISEINDGELEFLLVDKVSRGKFIALVADYKNGTHIDREKIEPVEKFKNFMKYIKIKKMEISGMKTLCADGEVERMSHATIEVVPKAVIFTP